MNETPNPHQEEPLGPGSAQENTKDPAAGSGRCVFDPIACALRKGAQDARKAAEQAAPKVKSVLSQAAYHVAYGVSYAAVFQYTLARILCPETIKAGARQGAGDGRMAGERFASRFQGESARTATEAPPRMGPTEGQPEPA